MANLYIFSSSLGVFKDSHAIRIGNYLNPEILKGKFERIYAYGVGSGVVRGVEVVDATEGLGYLNKEKGFIRKNLDFRFVYPDAFKGLSEFVYKKLINNVCENDVVISASGSLECHLGVLKVRKKQSFVWIADYGDPLSYVEKKMRPWFYFRAVSDERNIVNMADSVLVTTEETKELFSKVHSALNLNVLEYGYQDLNINFSENSNFCQTKFRTGHIGVAYKANRDLRPFIHALSDLAVNVNFYMAGPRSGAFDRLASNYSNKRDNFSFDSDSYVEYFESIKKLLEFDVMPVIGNKSNYQIPGKCFILVSLPVPILYIKQTDKDPFLRIFGECDGVLVCENSRSDIKKMLNYYLQNRKVITEQAKNRIKDPVVLRYSDRTTTTRLMKVIDESNSKRSQ